MTGLAIAILHPGETEAAVALWQATGLTRPWNDPRADIALALNGPSSTLLAGHVDGRLVATVMVGHDGHRGWIYYLAVAPDVQRRGIGRRMLAAAEDWARRTGVPKLQLMVRAENVAVRGFYEALGYALSDTVVLARWIDGR